MKKWAGLAPQAFQAKNVGPNFYFNVIIILIIFY
jgi:hypothetical protein